MDKIHAALLIIAVILLIVILSDNIAFEKAEINEGNGEEKLVLGAKCVAGDWPYCGCTPPDGGSCETEDYNARCEDSTGAPLIFCEVYYDDSDKAIGCYCRDNAGV